MALSRALEEHELNSAHKRIYADIRSSLDLPFVPTMFKLSAGIPEYLRVMWSDLGAVARSREFQTACGALRELAHSLTVRGGWLFEDQHKLLLEQKFSTTDIHMMGGMSSTFAKAVPQMMLFARLMQRGYTGGQRGRVTSGKQAAALSRLVTLHVPPERDAGLRGWLLYSDIRRTTGARHVVSMFRVLSPFPGYLASVWMDSKKMLHDAAFRHASEDLARRARGLILGLPVKDHRAAAGKDISAAQWRDIEETVDNSTRLLPQFALLSSIWERSFATGLRLRRAG